MGVATVSFRKCVFNPVTDEMGKGQVASRPFLTSRSMEFTMRVSMWRCVRSLSLGSRRDHYKSPNFMDRTVKSIIRDCRELLNFTSDRLWEDENP